MLWGGQDSKKNKSKWPISNIEYSNTSYAEKLYCRHGGSGPVWPTSAMLSSVAKNKKVVETFFFHFMDISAPNAYIVHKKITEGMTHKDFRQCLANELLERSELQLNPNPSPGRPLRSSVHEEHCLVPLTSDHLTRKSSKATFARTNCKLCSILFKKEQKTPWRCRTYDIPLCLQLDRNRFEKWHTAECDKFRNWFFWF